jgi:dTDP-4-dehydrorhamnose reductase
LQGVHHFTDAGVASWYDFAVAIQEEALALGLLPRAVPVRPIRTADYPTPARRPAYSVLDKTDTWRALAIEPLHWRAALREVLQYLSSSDQ